MLVIDIFLLFLITLCVFYCFKLSKRIENLNNMKQEFSSIIQELNKSISKAEISTTTLTNHSNQSSQKLSSLIEQADKVSDDLVLIKDVGVNLHLKLEKLIEKLQEIEEKKITTKKRTRKTILSPNDEKKNLTYNNQSRLSDSEVIENETKTLELEREKKSNKKQTLYDSREDSISINLDQDKYYNSLRKIGTKK